MRSAPLFLLLVGCVGDPLALGDGGGNNTDTGTTTADTGTMVDGSVTDTGMTNMDGGGVDTGPVDGGTYCDDIVGWWTGDDTLTDKKGMNNLTSTDPRYYAAKVNAGINIPNGIENTASKTNAVGLAALPELTIEAWIFIQGGITGDIISYSSVGTANGWYLRTDNLGFLVFSIYNIGTVKTVSKVASGWHHVAGTYTPSGTNNMIAYIDGVALVQETHNGGATPSPANPRLRIGAGATDSILWIGIADEVTVYKRKLTLTQLNNIYLAGAAGKCK